jgi:hypothetical protein
MAVNSPQPQTGTMERGSNLFCRPIFLMRRAKTDGVTFDPVIILRCTSRPLGEVLGHKSIQHTVRYTEPAPTRFKSLCRD